MRPFPCYALLSGAPPLHAGYDSAGNSWNPHTQTRHVHIRLLPMSTACTRYLKRRRLGKISFGVPKMQFLYLWLFLKGKKGLKKRLSFFPRGYVYNRHYRYVSLTDWQRDQHPVLTRNKPCFCPQGQNLESFHFPPPISPPQYYLEMGVIPGAILG